jgi:hypothetical protein
VGPGAQTVDLVDVEIIAVIGVMVCIRILSLYIRVRGIFSRILLGMPKRHFLSISLNVALKAKPPL